ncbi:OsmC family protein [Aliiruegeria sabulilitoris]|uniref:OsmC family protein n=1 Tax=Aliiruegeria sabulilitoris TaxID=1510458 RepID=UPI00083032F2|nr:OsmC family protein [Aliiruegeria sabulilitoris]NDR58786.1 OsmC family protein [Pseudoruegeria sp. M32A2M]
MGIRIKPKSFGPIYVRSNGDGALLYADRPEDFNAVPPHATPVDLLLASVGACIAKSLEIVAEQRGQTLFPFSVEVTGKKATDLPNRLGSADIRVVGKLTDDAELSVELLRQAKSICTISNTLNCPISLDLDRER